MFNFQLYMIMSDKRYYQRPGADERRRRRQRINIWLWVGVVVLIGLLILWLTWADLLGDTDVAAFIRV